MKITNKYGLPAPLVKAVTMTRHESNDDPNAIRVSQVIMPAQIRALLKKHYDEIEVDVSELIFSLLGTLLHDKLENSAKDLVDCIAEEGLSIEISGWKVTGHYDLSEFTLEGELLTDWKLTSVYALKDPKLKPEWVAQVNIYAELIRLAGRKVSEAKIIAIGRDWVKKKALQQSDYPQTQVLKKFVPLWTSERVHVYLQDRIALHQKADREGTWPECTPEERWAKPEVWAIMKKGNKRAIRNGLHYNPESADKHLNSIPKDKGQHFIEHRPGESTRCADGYCPVSNFCPQWRKLNPTLSDSLEQSIQIAQTTKEQQQWHSKTTETETVSS